MNRIHRVLFKSIFQIVIVSIISLNAESHANGPALNYGIHGGNILILDSKPPNGLTVDEYVDINGIERSVSVRYYIENKNDAGIQIHLGYPVLNELAFASDKINLLENITDLDFKVSLNNEVLTTKEKVINDVKLSGIYEQLKSVANVLIVFDVFARSGANILQINHNLLLTHPADISYYWHYTYPIWPAKNWVKKFRYAKYRVIVPEVVLPEYKRNIEIGSDNWALDGEEWYYKTCDVTGPGLRHTKGNEIIFTVRDFVPSDAIMLSGSLKIQRDLFKVYCVGYNDVSKCWKDSVANNFEVKMYEGSRRCYEDNDLNLIPIATGSYPEFIKFSKSFRFLRNEIYARKGYIFQSDEMRTFFSKIPWYFPFEGMVKLNEIEKWNVEFIKEAEKAKLKAWDRFSPSESLLERYPAQCRKQGKGTE